MIKIRYVMTAIFKHKQAKGCVAGSLSLLIFVVACSQGRSEKTTGKTENQIDSVKVFTIETDSVKKTLTFPGELHPNEDAQIRAKVQGYVRKMLVDIGTKVSKGQVLALIEAPELNIRIQELKEKASASRSEEHTSELKSLMRISNAAFDF